MHLRLHIALAALSAALIAYQLVLMQIFSLVQWHHFAFVIISIAMLGFGASGTFLTLMRERLVRHADRLIPLFMILSGMAMALVAGISQWDLFRFDSYRVFLELRHVLALVLTCLLFFLPFALGALAIGLIFVTHVERIGSVYFSNLAGSALGGIAAIALMWLAEPTQLPHVVGILAIVAGALALPQNKYWLAGLLLVSTSVILYRLHLPPELVLSEYKSLSRTLNLPDATIEQTATSPHGLVHIVSSPSLRYAPGLSLTYRKPVPVRSVVFNNGDWFGPVVAAPHKDETHLLDYTTMALPFEMAYRERVLVLHAGSGINVAHALARGAVHVAAVEPNGAAVALLRGSVLDDPAVSVHTVQPRTFVAGDTSRYDLIILPLLDAFGGTAGVYAMQEQYTFTTEALHEMWDKLTDDGALSLSSWMDYPPRNPPRALATLVAVLEERGVDPASHLAVVRSWGTVTFVATRTPLGPEVIERVRAFCEAMLFDPVILPGMSHEDRTRHHALGDEQFFHLVDDIMTGERNELYNSYTFNIAPTTDNRPYFSQFLRWKSVPELASLIGQHAIPFMEIGYVLVVATFAVVIILAIVLILLPLARRTVSGRSRGWTLVYFAAIGTGFMLMEIVMIQKFVLYFGHAIYAAAAVIGGMLIASGAGSYVSATLEPDRRVIARIALVVGGLILLVSFLVSGVLSSSVAFSLFPKILVTLLVLGPVSFLMGMLFPLGLRFLSRRVVEQVPWAWGINGCMSVVSATGAAVLAVEVGFQVVLIAAAAMYLVGGMVTMVRGRLG
jgi:hypothetical protein